MARCRQTSGRLPQYPTILHRNLVGPSTVLTAAHCAFNPLTQRYWLPGSLHFLIGNDGNRYTGHGVGVKLKTGLGFDPSRPFETRGSDWALISLDARLGSSDRILPMIQEVPQIGSTITLGGTSKSIRWS
jgi:protease YdgD